jgi:hypothetical protein
VVALLCGAKRLSYMLQAILQAGGLGVASKQLRSQLLDGGGRGHGDAPSVYRTHRCGMRCGPSKTHTKQLAQGTCTTSTGTHTGLLLRVAIKGGLQLGFTLLVSFPLCDQQGLKAGDLRFRYRLGLESRIFVLQQAPVLCYKSLALQPAIPRTLGVKWTAPLQAGGCR